MQTCLPDLFNLHAGRFYIQLASEPNRQRVLGIIREHAKPDELIYVVTEHPKAATGEHVKSGH